MILSLEYELQRTADSNDGIVSLMMQQ